MEFVRPKRCSKFFFSKLENWPSDALFYLKNITKIKWACFDMWRFLEKNRDTLSIDLKSVLANQSKNYFVNILYPPTTSGSDNKTSLGKEFRNQLISLIAELSRTRFKSYM